MLYSNTILFLNFLLSHIIFKHKNFVIIILTKIKSQTQHKIHSKMHICTIFVACLYSDLENRFKPYHIEKAKTKKQKYHVVSMFFYIKKTYLIPIMNFSLSKQLNVLISLMFSHLQNPFRNPFQVSATNLNSNSS
jgi:hypothetical protein